MKQEELAKLTPEEKRIKIAEACGWHSIKQCECKYQPHGLLKSVSSVREYRHLPDYLNDLNAALTLCNVLAEKGWRCHIDNGLDKTWECTFTHSTWTMNEGSGDQAVSHYAPADTLATAISRAFLLTVG